MANLVPIGIENFVDAQRIYYVDKTLIIKDLLDGCVGKAILITRPRRFGKSITLSMLETFFSNKMESKGLFENRKIGQAPGNYMDHCGKYPVIRVNMKNVASLSLEAMKKQCIDLISSIYQSHRELMDSSKLFRKEKEDYIHFANADYEKLEEYEGSILTLAKLLSHHYGERVILLIDEYDRPFEAANSAGFYEGIKGFLSNFYSASLKANDYLLFSLTTGVLQVAKESIFSQLNNSSIHSVLESGFSPYFGFDEVEVRELFAHYGCDYDVNEVFRLYGGYQGKANPWSVLSLIEFGHYDYYWTNTGSNRIVSDLLLGNEKAETRLNEIISEGRPIPLSTSYSYDEIKTNIETLSSFLVQTGYLAANRSGNKNLYTLSFPNEETSAVFQKEVVGRAVSNDSLALAREFKIALLKGDVAKMDEVLKKYVLRSFSYFEMKKEKDYQILLLSILAILFGEYVVSSEENSSKGRCDIMLLPKDKKRPAMVMELKYYDSKNGANRLDKYLDSALDQIKANEYYEKALRHGARTVYLYAMVFDRANNVSKMEEIHPSAGI